jgi:hypothetical protein
MFNQIHPTFNISDFRSSYSILFISLCLFFLQTYSVFAVPNNRWIDGTPFLMGDYGRFSVVSEESKVQRAPADQAPQIGDQRKFYAADFSRSGKAYFVNSTCRAVGEFCYIFVEDTQWQKEIVKSTGVAKIKRAFDDSTPADNTKGIYEIEAENLGLPPDQIDLDPKIYILILDIPDSANAGEGFIAGYFDPVNQKRGILRDSNGTQFRSNEVEMIYLDSHPLDIEDIMAREILAHEFQHLIHWRYDPDEDIWVNEGCSDYASLFLCGYQSNQNSSHVEAFERSPEVSLVHWKSDMSNTLANYGASYLWMLYLHEHYGGVSTISAVISQPENGIDGMNAVLSSRGYSQSFGDVFSDWKIANYLDDESFESGRYGYKSLDIHLEYIATNLKYPINGISRSINSWAGDYVEFSGGSGASNLNIAFNSDKTTNNYNIRVISLKNVTTIAVEDMPVKSGEGRFSISFFGRKVDRAIMVSDWRPKSEGDFDNTVGYKYSASLGDGVGISVAIMPNAINGRYADIIAQIDGDTEGDIPIITITRLGKVIVDRQKMIPLNTKSAENAVYIHQVFIPSSWKGIEVKWSISYLGQSMISGDLESINQR